MPIRTGILIELSSHLSVTPRAPSNRGDERPSTPAHRSMDRLGASKRGGGNSDRNIEPVRLPAILDGALELALDRPPGQSPTEAGPGGGRCRPAAPLAPFEFEHVGHRPSNA